MLLEKTLGISMTDEVVDWTNTAIICDELCYVVVYAKSGLKCQVPPTLSNEQHQFTFDQLFGPKRENKMATLLCLQEYSSLSLDSCCNRWKS